MNIIKILTPTKRTQYTDRPIKYIVIHYFGSLGSAKSCCNGVITGDRDASAHFFVDNDPTIYQSVEEKDAAWHCADMGTGLYKTYCKNYNSIGIEMRPYKVNTKSLKAGDRDWYFQEATIKNTIELVSYLMKKYGIDIDHVIRHYDVTEKWCPRPFIGNDINTYYNKPGNQVWLDFKRRIEEATMESKKIKVLMNGRETILNSYLINGENHVKLRDLANAQTDDKLTVDWDAANQKVIIASK